MRFTNTFRYWKNFQDILISTKGYHPKSDMSHRPFPSVVQIQTLNACNASCIMCPYGKMSTRPNSGRMDDALWDKIVNEILEHDEVGTFIPMLQNEPFLDVQILNKVKQFKEKAQRRVLVELITHGGLLSTETIEAIRYSNLDILSISIDSIHKEIYEKIRVGLDYDLVMSNIDHLIKAKLKTKVAIRMVRQTANRNEVKEFVAFWKARGLETVLWDVGNRSGAVPHFESLKVPKEKEPWYALVSTSFLKRVLPHCPVPFYMTSLLHNGDLLVCGFDWKHELILGNVRHQTIAEIWNSDQMKEIRRLHYEKKAKNINLCNSCSIWQTTWDAKKPVHSEEIN